MPIHYVKSLLLILLKSTGHYVYCKISHPRDREAYLDAMKKCIHLVEIGNDDYFSILETLETSRQVKITNDGFMRTLIKYITSSSNPQRYYIKAHDHAIDALSSLMMRFVVGSPTAQFKIDKVL
jgi:hypothetical protein